MSEFDFVGLGINQHLDASRIMPLDVTLRVYEIGTFWVCDIDIRNVPRIRYEMAAGWGCGTAKHSTWSHVLPVHILAAWSIARSGRFHRGCDWFSDEIVHFIADRRRRLCVHRLILGTYERDKPTRWT